MTTVYVSDAMKGTLHSRWARAVAPQNLATGTLTEEASAPVEWEIPIDGVIAPWLEVMINDINAAARLPRGWDSYNASPLKQKAALHGIELLEGMCFGGPAPWISPTPDGMLHLEWSTGALGVEIEVSEHGDVEVLVEESGNIEEWSTTRLGDDRLKEILLRLSNH